MVAESNDRPLRGLACDQPASEAGGFEIGKLVVEPVQACFHAWAVYGGGVLAQTGRIKMRHGGKKGTGTSP